MTLSHNWLHGKYSRGECLRNHWAETTPLENKLSLFVVYHHIIIVMPEGCNISILLRWLPKLLAKLFSKGGSTGQCRSEASKCDSTCIAFQNLHLRTACQTVSGNYHRSFKMSDMIFRHNSSNIQTRNIFTKVIKKITKLIKTLDEI